MKIVELQVAVIPSGLSNPMGSTILVEPSHVFVRIATDENNFGIGAATATLGGKAVGTALQEIERFILGRNPLDRELIWQSLSEVSIVVFPPQALAAIDCALWDLAGRYYGAPVHRLLGTYRERVQAYASTLTYPTIDEYLNVIDGCLQLGFRAVKLHPWGQPERDIELCRQVREHVGPNVALMLDAVGSYDLPQAMKVGRAIERLDFEWFEMPIRDQSIFGYQQLASALDIPITSGEVHTFAFQEASNYLSALAWDIVRIDATISGGITGAKKAASLAEGFGVNCEIHSFGHVLAQAANLQVIASIANCRYFETPLPMNAFTDGVSDLLDFRADGTVQIPNGAGLGVEVDWNVVASASVI